MQRDFWSSSASRDLPRAKFSTSTAPAGAQQSRTSFVGAALYPEGYRPVVREMDIHQRAELASGDLLAEMPLQFGDEAAPPDRADRLYEHFVAELEEHLGRPVPTGEFGALMDVHLTNDGPVTLWVERRADE